MMTLGLTSPKLIQNNYTMLFKFSRFYFGNLSHWRREGHTPQILVIVNA